MENTNPYAVVVTWICEAIIEPRRNNLATKCCKYSQTKNQRGKKEPLLIALSPLLEPIHSIGERKSLQPVTCVSGQMKALKCVQFDVGLESFKVKLTLLDTGSQGNREQRSA